MKAMAEETEYDTEPNDEGEIEKRPGKLSDYIPSPYKNDEAARAKDVVEFLNWAAEPEMDQRKKMGLKVLTIGTVLFALSVWVKRYKWSPLKTRKIVYNPPIGPKR